MRDTIHQISPDYQLSTDYQLLAQLARKQSMICVVDYSDRCRDVAHTLYTPQVPKTHANADIFQVSARGYGYIYAIGEDEFIKQCSQANLGFLVP